MADAAGGAEMVEAPPGPRMARGTKRALIADAAAAATAGGPAGNGEWLASVFRFAETLQKDYGWKFMVMLASNYVGVKGLVGGVVMSGQLPYYRSRGVSAAVYQDMQTISRLPWGAKGLFGVVSDSWPMLGYHKRYYIVFSGVMATCSLGLLAFASHVPVQVAAACLFMVQLYVAVADLLCEGKYAEIMSSRGGSSTVVTYVWGCVMFGSLLSACLVGPMADFLTRAKAVHLLFALGIPTSVLALWPALQGYLPEERQPSCGCKSGHVFEHRKIVALALGQSACALCMLPLLLLRMHTAVKFAYSVVSVVVLVAASYQALPRVVANCNMYMFCGSCLTVGVSVLDLWYTASPLCVPGGPMFSQTYYLTFCVITGSLAGLAGVWTFETYMTKWNARKAFWVTTVVKVVAALVDQVLISRWNLSVGLPDEYAFFLGNAVIREVVVMLDFMPVMVLIGKLCPKNIEATVFAVLAGFSNFGANIGNVLGTILFEVLDVRVQDASVRDHACFLPGAGWVNATVNSCTYDLGHDGQELRADCEYGNLGIGVFIAQVVCPLLAIPLTFVLIPNVTLDSDFLAAGLGDSGEVELPALPAPGAARAPPLPGGGGEVEDEEAAAPRGAEPPGSRRRSSLEHLAGAASMRRRSSPLM